MNIKEILKVLLTPAGLCAPQSLRLVWVNLPLERLLHEHSLERTVSVRMLASDLISPTLAGDENSIIREEGSLPATKGADSLSARCQLGPAVDVGGDQLLLFHLLQRNDSDSARATLNIFSRHMNAREASWEKEREALLNQIEALKES